MNRRTGIDLKSLDRREWRVASLGPRLVVNLKTAKTLGLHDGAPEASKAKKRLAALHPWFATGRLGEYCKAVRRKPDQLLLGPTHQPPLGYGRPFRFALAQSDGLIRLRVVKGECK